MNTTTIGTEFEKKVYQYLEVLLKTEKLPNASSKYSKIFYHKKYICGRSGRAIETDISIETYNPYAGNQEQWSTLIIIECKCYNSKVNISDYDEFRRKLTDISEYGVKGIIVTTKGFSQTNIELAGKEKIALVVFSDQNFNWLVGRCLNKYPEQLMPILKGEQSVGLNPISYYKGHFFSTPNLLNVLDVALKTRYEYYIPFLSSEELKKKAKEIYQLRPLQTNDVAGEVLAKNFPMIEVRYDNLSQGLLGTIDLRNNIITLSEDIISDTNRVHFTLAHEIGHLVLHRKFLRKEFSSVDDYIDISILSDKNIKRMEYQANVFASYLLLPERKFYYEVALLFKEYSITKGRLYLDHQLCNRRNVSLILQRLSRKFQVSQQAIAIRLKNEKLLIEADNCPKRIEEILL
ncbi:ImmA/IrrE family metallo-endopeptidase [Alloprevotella tannerae]|uniref:ImmA/IrrE family metallo-endopeptidase n=1 Tax=Alloprevotella tannerae TaxID=76122 RepID=UPI001EDA95EA|nr:ImmA/IrrE family metallo-endopeptidase [Alloprevotella tannerae]MCG2647340.1 ImmA/IrrE family metallo-endopeptidase [Alloprevotella tannerae]